MTSTGRGSDIVLTFVFAIIAGAVLGAAAGMIQNATGWRTGFLVPMAAGIVGASAAMFYRSRRRRREQASQPAPLV